MSLQQRRGGRGCTALPEIMCAAPRQPGSTEMLRRFHAARRAAAAQVKKKIASRGCHARGAESARTRRAAQRRRPPCRCPASAYMRRDIIGAPQRER